MDDRIDLTYIQKGTLVKWYELYGDIHIVKNVGNGIVIDYTSYPIGGESYLLYKVLTDKGHVVNFEKHCLEQIEDNK